MKKYPARQSCEIILILVIWGVVNSTQALKAYEFCVSFWKAINWENKLSSRSYLQLQNIFWHFSYSCVYLWIKPVHVIFAPCICSLHTFLPLLVKNLPRLRWYPKSEKAQVFFEKEFLSPLPVVQAVWNLFSFKLFWLVSSKVFNSWVFLVLFCIFFLFPLNLRIHAASLLLLPDHSRRSGPLLICFDMVRFGLYSFWN